MPRPPPSPRAVLDVTCGRLPAAKGRLLQPSSPPPSSTEGGAVQQESFAPVFEARDGPPRGGGAFTADLVACQHPQVVGVGV